MTQLDRWVREYNYERRHQGIGDVVSWEWFRLDAGEPVDPVELVDEPAHQSTYSEFAASESCRHLSFMFTCDAAA